MTDKNNRCPNCQSEKTVIDKIPGEENTYLFICDSCHHYHQIYMKDTVILK